MNSTTRIEPLNKDNYDTWKMQIEAILIKNDLWQYVSGDIKKPEETEQNRTKIEEWIRNDKKAKADIILCVSPSELTQLKGCETSRSVWQKLENVYASKGPARKATLLKQLTLQRLPEGENMRN
nr:PREDICTED: uncharacterized protein LOC105661794 [Megachile rotundata]